MFSDFLRSVGEIFVTECWLFKVSTPRSGFFFKGHLCNWTDDNKHPEAMRSVQKWQNIIAEGKVEFLSEVLASQSTNVTAET